MSSAVTQSVPGAGCRAGASTSGNIDSSPAARNGTPRGAVSRIAPTSPAASDQGPGRAIAMLAAGRASSHCRKPISGSISASANRSSCAQSGSDQGAVSAAAIDSGVTTRLTQGIATALATGPTSDRVENSAATSGVNATVAAHWDRTASPRNPAAFPHRVAGAARPPCPAMSTAAGAAHQRIATTAPKESQKPAAPTAQGSAMATMPAATSAVGIGPPTRPDGASTAAVASIQQVRCAGMPQPDSSAYPNAQTTATSSTRICRGRRATSGSRAAGAAWVNCRQSHPDTAAATNASIVTCMPEMAIRWLTPVRENSAHIAGLIAP